MYNELSKYYYKSEVLWEETYSERFNNLSAVHLDFSVREYKHQLKCPLFFIYTNDIALLQSRILKANKELTGICDIVPPAAIQQFSVNCLVNEIRASNNIEGIKSSRREIKQAYDTEVPNRYMRLWGIVNKYKMILSQDSISLSSCEDIRALYNEFILKEIIKNSPGNIPDGQLFRKSGVDVVTPSQDIIHRGTEPEEEIISSLTKALEILNNDEIPSLIRIAIFHYLFGYIHPFYDGNGRMSRFITSYLLAKETDITVAFGLSLLINKHRKIYYDMFRKTNSYINRGDLTPFIIGSLELILASAQMTARILKKKQAKFNRCTTYLENITQDKGALTKAIYHILLQAAIFSNSGATITEISDALSKSPKTIRTHLDKIPAKHIKVSDKHKPYRYRLRINPSEPVEKQGK